LTESSRPFFEEGPFSDVEISKYFARSVCTLAGSEQLAGMKEVADWRCPNLDAKTLPNSQQPKRKRTQNVSKKIKPSQLQILVVN
jgi:hypothetical protein